jgi:hypothetical protein
MRIIGLFELKTKYRIIFVLLALFGALYVFLSTRDLGAGLSPDSVEYISTARNFIKGLGFINYANRPTVIYAPLYPALLALIGGIFRSDPLLIANILNAIIFGFIIYLVGMLSFDYFSSFPAIAILGTITILFSSPLFKVSVMAWTEPLFILFVIISLFFANLYISKKNLSSLIILSIFISLASLTRYIGVTLLLWGGLIILFINCRSSLKNKLSHLIIFFLITTLPLGSWLIRNYMVSGTFMGPRASSGYSLFQNIKFVFTILKNWYLPSIIVKHRSILMIVSLGVGLLAGYSLAYDWQVIKIWLRQTSSIIFFIIIYTAFLIISSTTTAYDQIDDRLLSPIYIPLILSLLVLINILVEPFRRRSSTKIVNSIVILGIMLWFVFPIRDTVIYAFQNAPTGWGYSSLGWHESETVQYLLDHKTIETKCTFYTNDPWAVYILANLPTTLTPAKTKYNSQEEVRDLSSLKGIWPEETDACLIWFQKIGRPYLFAIDELQTVADMHLFSSFNDGAIYSITR